MAIRLADNTARDAADMRALVALARDKGIAMPNAMWQLTVCIADDQPAAGRLLYVHHSSGEGVARGVALPLTHLPRLHAARPNSALLGVIHNIDAPEDAADAPASAVPRCVRFAWHGNVRVRLDELRALYAAQQPPLRTLRRGDGSEVWPAPSPVADGALRLLEDLPVAADAAADAARSATPFSVRSGATALVCVHFRCTEA